MTTTQTFQVAALGGDGVGPEVVTAGLRVLREAARAHRLELTIAEAPIGGAALDTAGATLPDATLRLCRESDAVLFGATGGPRWDHLTGTDRPGSALLRLRRELGLAVNLRPIRARRGLAGLTPLREAVSAGCDLLVVRELTGGIYFGDHGVTGEGEARRAHDVMTYSVAEIRRVAEVALRLAAGRRGRLVSVDKANVLSSSRLWRETVGDLAQGHPGVRVEHQLVDSFAFSLIADPGRYDVIVTENLFGDILSDLAGVIEGSLGLLGSASLNPGGGPGLYEPVHGSAPDIAGAGVANPIGAIESVALMLEHSLGSPVAARAVRDAVDAALTSGVRTPDLGGEASTEAMTEAILSRLPAPAPEPVA
jgi:3-isopropylmalate dehydrogenase